MEHLNIDQNDKLAKMFKTHKQLFSGGLGTLNIPPIRLELDEDATPYHARTFPVPKSLERTRKK